VLSLILAARPADERCSTETLRDHERIAQGILVQPDASDLEPPSIADEENQQDDDDDGDDGGESVPAVIAPNQGVIEVLPGVPETRQEELERPGARQTETERGDGRQDDLDMPYGPGQKY
jgi:hypothetical protein